MLICVSNENSRLIPSMIHLFVLVVLRDILRCFLQQQSSILLLWKLHFCFHRIITGHTIVWTILIFVDMKTSQHLNVFSKALVAILPSGSLQRLLWQLISFLLILDLKMQMTFITRACRVFAFLAIWIVPLGSTKYCCFFLQF